MKQVSNARLKQWVRQNVDTTLTSKRNLAYAESTNQLACQQKPKKTHFHQASLGQQAFVLFTSRKPLPAYKDWSSKLEQADDHVELMAIMKAKYTNLAFLKSLDHHH